MVDNFVGTRTASPLSYRNHVNTPIRILRFLLTITSMIAMTCLISAGTPFSSIFSLPFVARFWYMLGVILSSTIITIIVLFIDVCLYYRQKSEPNHCHLLWVIAVSTIECAAFLQSSALIFTLVSIYEEQYLWIGQVTKFRLTAASAFGFVSGLLALTLIVYGFYGLCRNRFQSHGQINEDMKEFDQKEFPSRIQIVDDYQFEENSKRGILLIR